MSVKLAPPRHDFRYLQQLIPWRGSEAGNAIPLCQSSTPPIQHSTAWTAKPFTVFNRAPWCLGGAWWARLRQGFCGFDLFRRGRNQQDGTRVAVGEHAKSGNLATFIDEGGACQYKVRARKHKGIQIDYGFAML